MADYWLLNCLYSRIQKWLQETSRFRGYLAQFRNGRLCCATPDKGHRRLGAVRRHRPLLAPMFAVAVAIGLSAVHHVSLVTWNLLAPCYATATKYPWASPDELAWPARRKRILSKLAEMDADVVCLQEVEIATWMELEQQLRDLGYDGVLQQTSRGHPVANAVCVRRSALEVVRVESRSRALITVLRAREAPQRAPGMASPLYLANVHLEASAEKGATRLAQLRKLLRRIELQCATDVANGNGRSRDLSPEADAHDAAVVIAGDFNFDRTSELHSFLSTGSFPAVEQGRTKGTTEYALLPLNDAYLETPPPWGPTVRSTYRNGRLLDFVWTSSAVEILRTMPASKLAGSTRPHQLPSATHPSDHLPIGAVFSWPGEPAHDVSGLRPAWQQLSIESVVKRRGTPKQ